jgi:hypothetical protein
MAYPIISETTIDDRSAQSYRRKPVNLAPSLLVWLFTNLVDLLRSLNNFASMRGLES